ncbi:hypothetical protein, conserved [Leishmania tarentolae]|uniref:Uncharacterized protein n=1 Tax=Leishmania tarentolae TaxID=5689 RepID=A0A640KB94_LEITA|nr:hypothetical protein, conserved [Leishmania tarentolae]
MLRHTSFCLASFRSAGGSAPRSKRPHSGAGTDAVASEAAAAADGVYFPWTARPWAVTYHVHYSQWKFVDTVFAHLATVAPAVLNDRAQQQGVRDVLCELEEPVVALRRQQARQARQLKKQEKALAANVVNPSPQPLASALQHTATTAKAPPSAAGPSGMTADGAAATEASLRLDSWDNEAEVPAAHEAVDRNMALLTASKKIKGNRKSKRASRKSATSAFVIYEL